ncbi:MAG: conjugal transfer protein TrbL family protein [Bacilli bacterium]
MIYFLSFWSDVGFSIKQALRTFSCKIACVLYDFIVDLYNVFMYTARAEILSSSFVQQIYNKVGMLLGIFMVFKLSFSLIQSLVDPNKFTDEKTGFGGIIKRSVISIVLLGITPSLFRMAFDFQNLIIGSANNTDNIIYKIIVGSAPYNDAASFGNIIASELYFGFYTENSPYKLDEGIDIEYPDGEAKIVTKNYANLKSEIENGASFNTTIDYLSVTNSGQYVINWNGLFAIAMAAFMIYILVTYCIQVATRVIQLAYLQLVAPVPILSYISDPDGAFKNWTRQCLTTYLDLFIRLAIIYFIITVSTQILQALKDAESILYQSTGLDQLNDADTMWWVVIFLIIGLLMFGKRVPDLLKDLFPNMGGGAATIGFGIKSPKKTLADIPIVGGPTNKALGYAGNLGKKAGKFAWSHTGGAAGKFVWGHTGGKIKNNYNRWKDDRTGYKEGYKKDKESEDAWKEYGNDFNVDPSASPEEKLVAYKKAFHSSRDKNGEYAASYAQLERTGEALKKYRGDTNSAEYRKLLADKEKAQKNHDVNREKYKDLARREDQLKRYANRHPEVKKNTSSASTTSSSSSSSPSATSNSYQRSNYKGTNQPINEQNSMFANMSDEEWKARRSQNEQEIREENLRLREANRNDPNQYFDKMDQQYADEYLKNNGVSDDFDMQYETKRGQMEDAYKKLGWSQDNDGKWTKNGNGS